MKIKLLFLLTCSLAIAAQLRATSYRLDPLWVQSPGGALTWLDVNNFQRGMAYNPKTDHLLIVDRNLNQIHIVDSQNGNDLGQLVDRGFAAVGTSGFAINMIGVDDDGAIYVGNLSNSTSTPRFVLYRWESESSTNIPVFGGTFDFDNQTPTISGADPGLGNVQRWGDTLDVRGSGTNVQVLLGSRGNIGALLRPTDAALTNFTSCVISVDVANAGSLGYTVKLVSSNSFWATAGLTGQLTPTGSPLRLFSLNAPAGATNGTATTLHTYTAPPITAGMSVVTVDPTQNLMAGLSIATPDTLNLFSIEDVQNNPVLFDSETIATDNANLQWAGNVQFVSNKVYVLDANNGISAFTINSEAPFGPQILSQPADVTSPTNSTVTFSVALKASTGLTYQWYKNSSNLVLNATNSTLTLTNIQASDAGSYRIAVSNSVSGITSSNALLVIPGSSQESGWTLFEPFDHATGALTGTSVGAGQTWEINGTGDDAQVTPGQLTITGLVAPTANCLTNGGSGKGARLPLATNITTGTIYYSFAMRVDSTNGLTASGGFIVALVNNTNSAYGTRMNIKTAAGGYLLGVARSGTGYVNDPTIYTAGQTLFIVGSYTYNAGANDDVVRLWINPSSSTFGAGTAPTATVSDASSGNDMTVIDQFTFRQASGTAAAVTFDELRLGTTWASVTPAVSTEPATLPTLKIVNNGNSTATVTWPAAYTTYILQSTPTLESPSWGPVSSSVNGTNNTATVSTTATSFLRLRK
ncbi:MAG: Protein of unknown function precursor containing a C-terminal secretion signal [Verrucomicrobiales bacterium]|nr:Protein of unknown function precursor containing a C-terminal secretion signal [Verrucomicrobiales bacterium]